MRVLVTGATGFLGRRIVHALRSEGHSPLALVRSDAASDVARTLGCDPVAGDLDRPEDLRLPNVEAVIHAAAHFRLSGPRATFLRTNVEGTRGLLAAARAAGIARFIHISAAAVVMDDAGSSLSGVDESAPTFPDSRFAYVASKARAEALVLAANEAGFATLALRPPGIWGPGDAFSTTLPMLVRRRQLALVGGGRVHCSLAHVDNVAEAAVRALAAGRGGRAYFVADGAPVVFRDFVFAVLDRFGLRPGFVPSVPYGLAQRMGAAMEAGARLLRITGEPPVTPTMVRLIGRPFTLNDGAARHELHYIGRVTQAEGLAGYRP